MVTIGLIITILMIVACFVLAHVIGKIETKDNNHIENREILLTELVPDLWGQSNV